MRKKRFIAMTLCVAMAFSMTSCGYKDSKKVDVNNPNAVNVEETEAINDIEADDDGTEATTEAAGKKTETEGALEKALKNTDKSKVIGTEKVIDKDETVYVVADAAGNKQEVIVSEWLKNNEKKDVLEDVSDLEDIENVKGDETFTKDGNSITWNAKGNPIYYRGKTDKELPVGVKITYYLDGKEVSPEEIAGKKGSVKIRFDYINNSKQGDVYTPFIMGTGFYLDNTRFSNVSVTNGKYVSDGNKSVVIGYGMPGLDKSLNTDISKYGVSIGNYFEVTADTTDFKLDMTLTIAATGLLNDDAEGIDLAGLEKNVGSLLNEYKGGVDKLYEGIAEYTDGVGKISEGTVKIADGADKLKDGSDKLYEGGVTLSEAIEQADGGAGKLKEAFEGENGILDGSKKISDGLNTLNESVKNINLPEIPHAADIEFTAEDKEKAAAAIAKSAEERLKKEGISIDTTDLDALSSMSEDEKVAAISAKAAEAAKVDPNIERIISDEAVQGLINDAVNGIIEEKTDEYMASESGQAAVYDALAEYKANTIYSVMGSSDAPSELALAAMGGLKAQYAANGVELSDSDAYAALYEGVEAKVSSDENVAAAIEMLKPYVRSKVRSNIADNYGADIESGVVDGFKTIIGKSYAAGYGKAYSELGKEMQDIAGNLKYIISVYADEGVMYGLDQGLESVRTKMSGFEPKIAELKEGVNKLSEGSKKLDTGLNQVYQGNSSLKEGLDRIFAGVPVFTSGLSDLSTGAEQLSSGAGTLKGGATLLDSHSDELKEGSKKLKDATNQVVDKIGGAKKDIDNISVNAKKIIEAGKEYDNFGGIEKGMTGNVKFIFKTGEVSANEE